MAELRPTLRHLTVWLLLLTVGFIAFRTWEYLQDQPRLSRAGDGSLELRRGRDGHIHRPGTVNGQEVDFLVDTGCSLLCFSVVSSRPSLNGRRRRCQGQPGRRSSRVSIERLGQTRAKPPLCAPLAPAPRNFGTPQDARH